MFGNETSSSAVGGLQSQLSRMIGDLRPWSWCVTTYLLVSGGAAIAVQNATDMVPGEFVVVTDRAVAQHRAGSAERSALRALQQIIERGGRTIFVARSTGDDRTLVRQLKNTPGVLAVEPNYVYSVSTSEEPASGDPFFSTSGSWGQPEADMWPLHQIHAADAWRLTRGDGVVVALVDTGVDSTHPDIAANVWLNSDEIPDNGIDDDNNGFVDDVKGWDFTTCRFLPLSRPCPEEGVKTRSPDVRDRRGHGTHLAGIIGAVGDNGVGIVGVAPEAQIMVVRALSDNGRGTLADLIPGIYYAADNGADVINLSWSGPRSVALDMAIEYAVNERDAVVVASAGNGAGPMERGIYPANIPGVLAVGASGPDNQVLSFSDFGGFLDLVAPGGGTGGRLLSDESILSLLAEDSAWSLNCGNPECVPSSLIVEEGYVRSSGTSMAAAYVSGVAALVRSNRLPRDSEEGICQPIERPRCR